MNSLGPYNINPFLATRYPLTPIPVAVGKNGFVEIVNLTNFNMFVQLQSMGSAFQEQRSKVCYRVIQSQQGTQMLTLTPTVSGTFANIPNRVVRNPYAGENGEIGFLGVYVNVYQEGEIEWYPPVALAGPPAETCYYESANAAGTVTLTLPNTSTYFGAPANEGYCSILGFDFSANSGATATSGDITITNLNNMPGGSTSMDWHIVYPANGVPTTLSIRFPTPIPNFGGQQITLSATVPAVASIIAYYSLT